MSEFFTTNAPDPPHWTLTSCFGVFRTMWVHLGQFVALLQKFVPRSRVGFFRNEHTWSTPLDSKLMFWCVSYYLDAFGTVWFLTKLSAKRAEVVQKFVPRSRVLIFHNKHTRLAALGTKLMFWCILYYLGVFGTIWLPYKTRCKMGRSGAKVRATKSRHNFSQQTHRIDRLGPKLMFWYVL